MNPRIRNAGIPVLAILGIVAGVLGYLSLREPLYAGLSVSQWMDQYIGAVVQGGIANTSPLSGTRFGPGRGGYPGRTLVDPFTGRPQKDPALDALRALGPRAVPVLIRGLGPGPFEIHSYLRLFVRLPDCVQPLLPDPWEPARRRPHIVEVLASLGPSAAAATPSLVNLLETTPRQYVLAHLTSVHDRVARPIPVVFSITEGDTTPLGIAEALCSIHQDPDSMTTLMQDLARRRHYRSWVTLAAASGWRGSNWVATAAEAVGAPEPKIREGALRLLEGAGTGAASAIGPVLATLKDPELEVRWLAARTVEAMGVDSPEIRQALQAACSDSNVLVSTVALRTLATLSASNGGNAPPGPGDRGTGVR